MTDGLKIGTTQGGGAPAGGGYIDKKELLDYTNVVWVLVSMSKSLSTRFVDKDGNPAVTWNVRGDLYLFNDKDQLVGEKLDVIVGLPRTTAMRLPGVVDLESAPDWPIAFVGSFRKSGVYMNSYDAPKQTQKKLFAIVQEAMKAADELPDQI